MEHGWIVKMIQEAILRSWWVYLFALVAYGLYEFMNAQQDLTLINLWQRKEMCQAQLSAQTHIQNELRLQLNSHQDPAWIELTLMRCLGVVPANQKKVYFYEMSQASDSPESKYSKMGY